MYVGDAGSNGFHLTGYQLNDPIGIFDVAINGSYNASIGDSVVSQGNEWSSAKVLIPFDALLTPTSSSGSVINDIAIQMDEAQTGILATSIGL